MTELYSLSVSILVTVLVCLAWLGLGAAVWGQTQSHLRDNPRVLARRMPELDAKSAHRALLAVSLLAWPVILCADVADIIRTKRQVRRHKD